MSEPLVPIPEFGDRDPIKLWRHNGIDCAIYMGFGAPCGYVRLPPGHPLQSIAEAGDTVFRAEDRSQGAIGDMMARMVERTPAPMFGHTAIDDDLPAPGGLTWGPTADGWVGFDTGHGSDIWDLGELRSFIPEGSEEREQFDKVAELGGHISQIVARHRIGYEIDWTLEKLVRVVEHLADQVLATAKVKR